MKEQYLKAICDNLNKAGFTNYDTKDLTTGEHKPFDVEDRELKQLLWLPEDNLERIASYDCTRYKNYRDLYQAWGRVGLFKFVPYRVKKENATLCLRHNRFLHMFRGRHYQISGTPDGIGECESGFLRTDGIINLLARDDEYCQSHLGFITLYAALIDCAFHNDNFRDLFYNDRKAVDEFFRDSMLYWGVKFDYGFEVLSKYISYEDGTLKSADADHPVYYVSDNAGIMCRFTIDSSQVSIEYCPDNDRGIGSSRIVTFKIPDPIEGMDTSKENWTDEDIEDLNDWFDGALYTHEHYEHFILLMLLKFVGIHSCAVSTYSIRKIGSIEPIEDEFAIKFEKFEQVME